MIFDELRALRGDELKISDKVSIRQPSINEIIDDIGERNYFLLVKLITSKPYDDKVLLDDMGFDYEEVSDYDYFCLSHGRIADMQKLIESENKNISTFISGIDFKSLSLARNQETGEMSLINKKNEVVIDRLIYTQMSEFIRKIHHIQNPEYNPGNKMMKKRIIEKERRKMKNVKEDEQYSSILAPIISSLSWDGFGLTNIYNMTVYQLMDGLLRKKRIKDYEAIIHGCYSGTVSSSDIDMNDISWCGDLYSAKKTKYKDNDIISKTKG